MFKRIVPSWLAMLGAMLIFSGCMHTSENAAATPSPASTETQRFQKPCAEILSAFQNEDYAQLKKILPESLLKDFTEDVFKQSCRQMQKSLGKMTGFTYLTNLQAPVFRTMVYKVQFERTSQEGKIIQQEALFRGMLSESKGKIIVLSFGFL